LAAKPVAASGKCGENEAMEKFIRDVAEIDQADRRAIEHLIGKHLAEHQQVIISVVNLDPASPDESAVPATGDMPAWRNIYEGLGDEEIDRLDRAIRQRANVTRALG
jgi:hypothetical protein